MLQFEPRATVARSRFFPENSQSLPRKPASVTPPAAQQDDLIRDLRRALARLHDPHALRRNPLSARFGGDGIALRDCLLQAIGCLRPTQELLAANRAERPHQLLQLRYVEALERSEVEARMAIGTSQFYRELENALEALAAILRARLFSADTADDGSNRPGGRHNLPAHRTSFVGRRPEIDSIKSLLTTIRLITLSGAGGCGKTRLALETATQVVGDYKDGVWLVDLTPLSEPGLIPQTVGSVVGIVEVPGEPMLKTLVRVLASRHLLLVLDNCEHLMDACAQLVDGVLGWCPNVAFLITSRERLSIEGEMVVQVAPLGLAPGDVDSEPEAVRLFADRAASVAHGFRLTAANVDAVLRICSRLDGLPLAIELAAARANVLLPEQIAERLDRRFDVLTIGGRAAPKHHQTLEALIDWSYELLSDSEKAVFQSLSVFAGGWSLEAAEEVCTPAGIDRSMVLGLLAALVDKSLVVVEPEQGAMRYRLLETLRAYAAERLRESGAVAEAIMRHARYYDALARQLERRLYGDAQLDARREFDLEHNNFRAVLSNASLSNEVARAGAHIAASISLCWFFGNYFTEARHWFDWLLSFPEVAEDPDVVRCLMVDGFLAASLGDHDLGMEMCNRALARARTLADAFTLAWSYFGVAATNFVCGSAREMEHAARAGVQASGAAAWPWGVAICRAYVGRSLLMQRRVSEAVEELAEAVVDSASAGDPFTRALSLSFYGAALGARGDYDTAAQSFEQSLVLFRELGSLAQQSRVLVDWTVLAMRFGRIRDAITALADGLTTARELGKLPYRFAQLFAAAAHLASVAAHHEEAARLIGCARFLRSESGIVLPPEGKQQESELLDRLRDRLGLAELNHLLSEASELDLDSAIALAEEVVDQLEAGTAATVE